MSNAPSVASISEMLLRGELAQLKQLVERTQESAAAVRAETELLRAALECSMDLICWYIDRERERNARMVSTLVPSQSPGTLDVPKVKPEKEGAS